jgi:hypothetical protein
MDTVTNLGFREVMFGYACETTPLSPQTVKVWIPEIMPDVTLGAPKDTLYQSSASIFVNDVKPQVSGSVAIANYIKLPILHSALYNNKQIPYGQQLVIFFIDKNPAYGWILGK